MPNTPGTNIASNLVIQAALSLIFTKRPLLNAISLNCKDLDGRAQGVAYNQVLTTRTHGLPTVQNFGTTESYIADTDVNVTMNLFKELKYSFSAAEMSATDRNYIQEVAEPLAVALANYFVDTVAALWVIGTFTRAAIVKGAGWDYTHLTAVRKVLQDAGIPETKRFYVANTSVYQSLLTDPLIVAALNNPDNAGAIKSGNLPSVAGFGLMEYPALPSTGNMCAFAGTPEGSLLVVRPPRDPQELLPSASFPGNSGYVQEPRTGLTIAVDEWIGTDRSANIRMSWMAGIAAGNTSCGQIIKTA